MTFEPANFEATATDGRTFCAVHPNVETTLKCNRCGRYMCSRCAVRTPVGYRCKECVHQQQDVYFSATQRDYAIAAVVAFFVSLPIALIVIRLGFLIILLASIPAGGLISEVVHRATGRRRGRNTWMFVAGAIVLSAVIVVGLPMLQQMQQLSELQRAGGPRLSFNDLIQINMFPIISAVIYVVMSAGTAMSRLRYGK